MVRQSNIINVDDSFLNDVFNITFLNYSSSVLVLVFQIGLNNHSIGTDFLF